MWKYFIELFTEDSYGEFIEGAETSDGVPVCSDLAVAKYFNSPEELNLWVKENTSYDIEKMEYGIKGVYYPSRI